MPRRVYPHLIARQRERRRTNRREWLEANGPCSRCGSKGNLEEALHRPRVGGAA